MAEIARLRIELDEVKPPVRRRIEVPLAIRLDDLHLVMQAAMGWENYHLYEFQFGRGPKQAYGEPDPDAPFAGSGPLPAKKASLADLLARATGKRKRFKYLYDFGDGWEHTVKLEGIAEAEPGTVYPRLVSAERACPPEDVGGPLGYAEYLEAIANPDHERHSELIEWRGEGFDPEAVDERAIRKDLDRIAARLARRKTRAGASAKGRQAP